jgi:hypothetical protein
MTDVIEHVGETIDHLRISAAEVPVDLHEHGEMIRQERLTKGEQSIDLVVCLGSPGEGVRQ